jgi:hypothetical protein
MAPEAAIGLLKWQDRGYLTLIKNYFDPADLSRHLLMPPAEGSGQNL